MIATLFFDPDMFYIGFSPDFKKEKEKTQSLGMQQLLMYVVQAANITPDQRNH